MAKLTAKQVKWWTEQTADHYTCTVCKNTGPRHTVQPQFPGTPWAGKALCVDCISDMHAEYDAQPH